MEGLIRVFEHKYKTIRGARLSCCSNIPRDKFCAPLRLTHRGTDTNIKFSFLLRLYKNSPQLMFESLYTSLSRCLNATKIHITFEFHKFLTKLIVKECHCVYSGLLSVNTDISICHCRRAVSGKRPDNLNRHIFLRKDSAEGAPCGVHGNKLPLLSFLQLATNI